MRHRFLSPDISALIDGELEAGRKEGLEEHLRSCESCRAEEAELRQVRDMLAGLPRLGLSEAGHQRIMRGLKEAARERDAAERARRASLFPRAATAAAVMIAVLLVTVAVMTTPTSKRSAIDGETGTDAKREDLAGQAENLPAAEEAPGAVSPGKTDPSASENLLLAAIPSPRLEVSKRDYRSSEVRDYSADLGSRLDFFSYLWHTGTPSGESLAAAREHCKSSLAEQARQLGLDPQKLLLALEAAESLMDGAAQGLPCFVEVAGFMGRRSCIISYSRPEDRMLFTDSELVPLVNLVRQSSPAILMQSSALQGALASSLVPQPSFESAPPLVGTVTAAVGELPCGPGDFNELLSSLASENNLVTYLRRVAELDSEHLLAAVSQELGYPLEVVKRLLGLLTMRVWVVDLDTGAVLAQPSR